MPRYELRLTLPDHPGALGTVAQALGHAGANIVSFEAVDVDGGTAVDQILLDLSGDAVAAVTAGLAELPDVDVEVFRPVQQRPMFDGPLELVEALVLADANAVLQTLVDGMPATLRVHWAAVVAPREPQPLRLAGSVGAPSMVEAKTPWLPLTETRALVAGASWVPARWGLDADDSAVAAAPLDAAGTRALLVVRKQGPAFRRRELRVLAGVALVAGRLAGD